MYENVKMEEEEEEENRGDFQKFAQSNWTYKTWGDLSGSLGVSNVSRFIWYFRYLKAVYDISTGYIFTIYLLLIFDEKSCLLD